MLRIAVIGCGRIGAMHAANIAAHPRSELVGVFDVRRSAAEDVARRLRVSCFASTEEIFRTSDIDAVLIASSTATHVDFIEQGVAAGKAILCEKPIDLSLKRVNDCAERIRGSKVPVMIGFCRRFDPSHRAARQSVLDGEIGELHQVIITSRDPDMAPDAYIEVSGGIFRDMTIHDLDLVRYLLGDEVTSVTAHGSRLVDPALMERCGDYDTVAVTLMTESGKQAIITNSRKALYGYDQRIELFGSKGMVISENHRGNHVTKHGAVATNVSAPLKNFFIERYREAFIAEIDSFVEAVEGRVPLEVDFDDGHRALVLAEACILSATEGRSVATAEIG